MSEDLPTGATVPQGTRSDSEYGRATHVERINPGDNPAFGPGAETGGPPLPEDRGTQIPYVLQSKGFHHGRLYRAGEVVMLYPDEVGPQHKPVGELLEPVEEDPPVPVEGLEGMPAGELAAEAAATAEAATKKISGQKPKRQRAKGAKARKNP